LAEKHARKLEGQLAAGTYEGASRKQWSEFRPEYETKGMVGLSAGTREITKTCLDHFERVAKPGKLSAITSRTIDHYVAQRREAVSAASCNKELRHIKAALCCAKRWNYLSRIPAFEFLREPGKLPTYVTPEHFAKLYEHAGCDRWRGLLVMAYMTGWRIGSLLALRWSDVDLGQGVAISRAADNKGKRDQRVPLHPLVVEHLGRLKSFSPTVFTGFACRRTAYKEFAEIQKAAGVRREDDRAYGFHDLRRAFATVNAAHLSADALQMLMQHKDYTTTQRYIAMAHQHDTIVDRLFVPKLASAASAG
jgi:integrase